MSKPEIIDISAENVDRTGFFCKMSARGKPGYERKLAWLKQRFDEGMGMKLLGGGERGFVEYIPSKYAWRAVENADDYLFVHCLWVVGKSKGKGFGKALLGEVEKAAREGGYKGVASVVSKGNWLSSGDVFAKNGFATGEQQGVFEIVTHKFDPAAPDPRFSGSFDKKLKALGSGLTVMRTDQCPYLDDAVLFAEQAASEVGVTFRVEELTRAADVRAKSPTPYGVFSMAFDGQLIAHHYLLKKNIAGRLAALKNGN